MKKLKVNEEACIGCGACVAIDPEHFDFNDDGLSNVISTENIESDNAKNAISSCPTNAISYVEINDDENNENANSTNIIDNKNGEDDENQKNKANSNDNLSSANKVNHSEDKKCKCDECHCENCDCEGK